MKNMNTARFIALLQELDREVWTTTVDHGCIHLRRQGSEMIFSPLTAVYFHIFGEEIHRGSFWCVEMTQKTGLPWWEVNEIVFASIASDCSRRYDRTLRENILKALPPVSA